MDYVKTTDEWKQTKNYRRRFSSNPLTPGLCMSLKSEDPKRYKMVSIGASTKSWFTYGTARNYDVYDLYRDELKRVADHCLEDEKSPRKSATPSS